MRREARVSIRVRRGSTLNFGSRVWFCQCFVGAVSSPDGGYGYLIPNRRNLTDGLGASRGANGNTWGRSRALWLSLTEVKTLKISRCSEICWARCRSCWLYISGSMKTTNTAVQSVSHSSETITLTLQEGARQLEVLRRALATETEARFSPATTPVPDSLPGRGRPAIRPKSPSAQRQRCQDQGRGPGRKTQPTPWLAETVSTADDHSATR